MAKSEIKFPCPVRRITIGLKDGKWVIEDETRIESMTLPKSHELPVTEKGRGIAGFWYEIVDKNGMALYRQRSLNPFTTGMEVFNADGSISRMKAMPGEISFDVFVPEVTEASALHIYSDAKPMGPEMTDMVTGAAEIIGDIDLKSSGGDKSGHR